MTAEFAERLTAILDSLGMTREAGGYLAEVSSSHMTRVTHNERGLAPDKAVNFMINAGIPAPEQAMFLLQAAGAPEVLATSWLRSFENEIGPMESLTHYTTSSVLQKNAPTKDDLKELAVKLEKDYSNLAKHWQPNTKRKMMDADLRLSLMNTLNIPESQRAQFFLAAAGHESAAIEMVLVNYKYPTVEKPEAEGSYFEEETGDESDGDDPEPEEVREPVFRKKSPVNWSREITLDHSKTPTY